MRSSYVLVGKVLGLGLMASQGFRNKVFVIEIPRELGRSSFKQSAMMQGHKMYIPEFGNPVCNMHVQHL